MPTPDPKAKAAELIESATVNGTTFKADGLLAEFKANAKAKAKTFELAGKTFSVPDPTTWPDGVFDAARKEDILGMAQRLLGDQYDAFAEIVGESAAVFFQNEVFPGVFGTTVGESSASSAS